MKGILNGGKAVLSLTLLLCLAALVPKPRVAADEAYDIAILNGRVMDPESPPRL